MPFLLERTVFQTEKKQILDERRDLDYLISMAEQGRSIEDRKIWSLSSVAM